MGRPKLPKSELKRKVTITPHPKVLAWVDNHVGLGKPFKDRTHAFETAVVRMMEQADSKK